MEVPSLSLEGLAAMMGGRIANREGIARVLPSVPRAAAVGAAGPDLPSRPPVAARGASRAAQARAQPRPIDAKTLIRKLQIALKTVLGKLDAAKKEIARLQTENDQLRSQIGQAAASAQEVWRAAAGARREEEEPEVVEGEVVEVEGEVIDPYGPDDDGGMLG